MKLLNLEQGSDEWLFKRKGSITGTDASIIMGVNPYKNRKQLLKEKLGLVEDAPPNEAMLKGMRLEPKAREIYMLKENTIVYPAVVVHDDYFWAMASLDGLSHNSDFFVEIKCGESAFNKALKGEIPAYYYAQMQHCMWVTGVKFCHYFCYWEGKGNIKTVERDEAYIEKLVEEEIKFYDEMLNTNPQDLLIQDIDNVELKKAIQDYESYKVQEEAFSMLKEEARAKILSLCGNKDTEAYGYKISKSLSRGRIQYDKIPELQNKDLEAYRAPSEERWMIKKLKEKDSGLE